MKSVKTLLALLVLAGATALLLSTTRTLLPWLTLALQQQSDGSYKYVLSTPPGHTQTDGDEKYMVFLSTGDGRYFNGSLSDLDQFRHTYLNSGTVKPFVEYWDVYDDDQKPGLAMVQINPLVPDVTVNGNSSGYDATPLELGDAYVLVEKNRAYVPTDSVTYMVTCHNHCGSSLTGASVTFTYPPAVLDYVTADNFTSFGTQPQNNSSAGEVTISNLNFQAGEQRTFFLTFETKIGVALGTQVQNVGASFRMPHPAPCSVAAELLNSTLATESVESSHDPNKKTITPRISCDGTTDMYFSIEFQNDGPDSAKNITVNDELDYRLRNCTPVLEQSMCSHTVTSFQYNSSTRILTAVFGGINLPGTGQPDYGVTFTESATKGKLVFRVNVSSCMDALTPCTAICNRADIVFECNPPVQTDLAMTTVGCNTSACFDSCSTTVINLDTLLTNSTPAPISLISTKAQNDYPKLANLSGWVCQWYPASGLNDSQIPNPHLTQDRNITYTLVASKSCERLVVHVPVKKACTLTLTATATPKFTPGTVCPADQQWDLAVCHNDPGNAANLVWNDCTPRSGACWNIAGQGPGVYYFSVKDPVTGCYDDVWLNLEEPQPLIQVSDNPNDCQANLVISGGTAPYTVAWTYLDQNGNAQTASGTVLDLDDKSQVMAVVTDDNGCSQTFIPQKNCGWWPANKNWLQYLLAIAAAAFVVLTVYRLAKKR